MIPHIMHRLYHIKQVWFSVCKLYPVTSTQPKASLRSKLSNLATEYVPHEISPLPSPKKNPTEVPENPFILHAHEFSWGYKTCLPYTALEPCPCQGGLNWLFTVLLPVSSHEAKLSVWSASFLTCQICAQKPRAQPVWIMCADKCFIKFSFAKVSHTDYVDRYM